MVFSFRWFTRLLLFVWTIAAFALTNEAFAQNDSAKYRSNPLRSGASPTLRPPPTTSPLRPPRNDSHRPSRQKHEEQIEIEEQSTEEPSPDELLLTPPENDSLEVETPEIEGIVYDDQVEAIKQVSAEEHFHESEEMAPTPANSSLKQRAIRYRHASPARSRTFSNGFVPTHERAAARSAHLPSQARYTVTQTQVVTQTPSVLKTPINARGKTVRRQSVSEKALKTAQADPNYGPFGGVLQQSSTSAPSGDVIVSGDGSQYYSENYSGEMAGGRSASGLPEVIPPTISSDDVIVEGSPGVFLPPDGADGGAVVYPPGHSPAIEYGLSLDNSEIFGGCECGDVCHGECGGPYPPGYRHRRGPANLAAFQILFRRFQFFSGATSFKGPANRGGDSSFGLQEGLNFSSSLPGFHNAISFQIGMRATQTNLNLSSVAARERAQIFATAGVFRRVDQGLQGGAVFDYLYDNWDFEASVMQVRGELSWVFPERHELGFLFATSVREDVTFVPHVGNVIVDTTDQFAFFHRYRHCIVRGAESRMFAGFTGDSDGLIGADYLLPVTNNVALAFNFIYLIPQETQHANIDESWNLSFNLVYYPGCGFWTPWNYCRPLFNVAGNGSLLLNNHR